MVFVEDIAAFFAQRGATDHLERLADPQFPVPDADGGSGLVLIPILGRDPSDRLVVRYQRPILQRGQQVPGAPAVPPEHRAAMNAFRSAVNDRQLQTVRRLGGGDLLLVDNRRVLHGRTAIRDGHTRDVKRIIAEARRI